MTSFYRLTGVILVVGAVLSFVGQLINSFAYSGNDPQMYVSFTWSLVQVVTFVGEMFMVFGLMGIVIRQWSEAKRLGFWGFVLTFFGGFLLSGATIGFFLLAPGIAQTAPKLLSDTNNPISQFIFFIIGGLLFGIGGVLLGLAIWRAGVFTKWAGLFLLLGAVINFGATFLSGTLSTVVNIVAFFLFAFALAWVGSQLMMGSPQVTTRKESVAQPTV